MSMNKSFSRLIRSLRAGFRGDLVAVIEFCSLAVFCLPRTAFLNEVKSLYLRSFFGAAIGRRVVYYSGVFIFTGRGLVVGDDVDFARGVIVTTDGGVEIGDRVLVGYGSTILSKNHCVPPGRGRIFFAGHVSKKVVIESDVWICSNCTICPGVRIGQGSVIAAGSVVTRDIPAFVFAAGVPARIIRDRL